MGAETEIAGKRSGPPGRRKARWWLGAGLALVVAIVAILVLAQGGGSGGPLNAIAKAAEVTQREPGGRAVFKAVVTAANSPEGLTENGALTFEESGRSSGSVHFRGHETGKEGQLQVKSDGTTEYYSSDLFESLPEGKKWMELNLAGAVSGQLPVGPAGGGPQEGLKILEIVQGAERVGQEEIRGVSTTRYRGTLPVAEEVFGVKLHTSGTQVEVWIDAENRVRRMRLSVSGSVGESEVTTTTEMTIDFVEFGRVPKIELPNPEEWST